MELYVVLATSVLVWAGLFFYMVNLDRKLSRLEEQEAGASHGNGVGR